MHRMHGGIAVTDTSPQAQFVRLQSKYEGVIHLSDWTTADLTRMAFLIDVELQERAFNASFRSPFDEVEDEFGAPRDDGRDY